MNKILNFIYKFYQKRELVIFVIIVPLSLSLISANYGWEFLEKVFRWNKFDSAILRLYAEPIQIISKNEEIFGDLFDLIISNAHFGLNEEEKTKIIGISRFNTETLRDFGPTVNISKFIPPTTRLAIDFDLSIVPDPKILGFDKVPDNALTFAYPIGTLSELESWNNNYKKTRRDFITLALSLVSVFYGFKKELQKNKFSHDKKRGF